MLDKISYLSRKEIAKHQTLTKNHDLRAFQYYDLKNDNEITLAELGYEDDPRLRSLFHKIGEADSDDGEAIDNLYEFWEEQDRNKVQILKERNPNIDQKLEEYLRSHSQQLSFHIQTYLNRVEKGQEIPVNERISNLGIMAFERSQFLKTLRKVKRAFEYQMTVVHQESKAKAKGLAVHAFSKIEHCLHSEVKHLLEKYSELRFSISDLILYNERLTRTMKTQEV